MRKKYSEFQFLFHKVSHQLTKCRVRFFLKKKIIKNNGKIQNKGKNIDRLTKVKSKRKRRRQALNVCK